MRNPLLDRINNERFTIRLVRIAEKNNIKTVGNMIRFAANWKHWMSNRILLELAEYMKNN